MGNRSRTNLWSPAERYGFIALALALAMFFLQPAMAVLPLAIFLLGCFAAPFFPRSSFFLPVISRASTATGEIALTFDDGPSPASTPFLLDLLARHQLPATFFVVGENAARYPELITAILAGGHTIGNHSLRHDYFLMLRTPKTLQADIRATQEILAKSGVIPLVFRPPIGICGPRLGKVLARENLRAVTYSCRALDRGNRDIRNLAGRILRRLRPGAIVMLHDLPPLEKTRTDQWQQELDRLFAVLKETYQVVPLAEIIQGPVMERTES